ncbi:MAG: ImmA/IrrE family metallo-endopeptidase [Conexivisphaerales archaeon]|jgi:O-acetyl-ADP-ribose deacetylase (regulator of RNase III)
MVESGKHDKFWTNPSVRALAADADPIAFVTEKAKSLVFRAVEDGWQGPPFDPFWLAKYCGLSAVPRNDIPDARLVALTKANTVIEYNPNQPRARVRFSVAHEIGHTLFPDYPETTRNRMQLLQERGNERLRPDEWQLELLCNLAAAEILMPSGFIVDEVDGEISIERLMSLWQRFDVSPEAFLIRIASATNQPVSIFAAARLDDGSLSDFRLDYCIPSPLSPVRMAPGLRIPNDTVLKECTAIGFTAKGMERWGGTEVLVECVGIPPYPGRTYPRVVGFLRPRNQVASEQLAIAYVKGDITQPRGTGQRIIAHIVNDKSSIWGAGAALAIAKRWPEAQSDFKNWSIAKREDFDLGVVHECKVSDDLWVVSMVAQHGFGQSTKPRIRYFALRDCLLRLGTFASGRQASVHMPRIGTGFAGGNWKIIEDLIMETLISRGVRVLVYDLPRSREESQMFLDSAFVASR